jgi:hypothetical protein
MGHVPSTRVIINPAAPSESAWQGAIASYLQSTFVFLSSNSIEHSKGPGGNSSNARIASVSSGWLANRICFPPLRPSMLSHHAQILPDTCAFLLMTLKRMPGFVTACGGSMNNDKRQIDESTHIHTTLQNSRTRVQGLSSQLKVERRHKP